MEKTSSREDYKDEKSSGLYCEGREAGGLSDSPKIKELGNGRSDLRQSFKKKLVLCVLLLHEIIGSLFVYTARDAFEYGDLEMALLFIRWFSQFLGSA